TLWFYEKHAEVARYICVGYVYNPSMRSDRKVRRNIHWLNASEPFRTELSETNNFSLSAYLTYSKFKVS
ncbi:hypothetical protein Q8G50_33800, partial [Klebsiella pneumoniae]